MADNIEYITFDNDEVQTTPVVVNGVMQPQSTAYINGSVEVDYTTGQVLPDGGLTVTQNGAVAKSLGFSGTLTQPSPGNYAFNSGGSTPSLNVTYQGMTPTQATGITYNSDPGQPDNMEYVIPGGTTAQFTSSTTPPPTCFVTGTRIATVGGPIAVEDLAAGDMALTSSGEARRIRWIGHRTLDCRRTSEAAAILPIRIAAHAFGVDLPSRDLVVSPGHAICVDVGGEVLIPAGALVNGTSVVREAVETVTYWHVELDSHDVLLAENLPCESYLDMGNRGFFVESGVIDLAATADAAARTHADFCRPYHADGALVEAVRCRLAARAETCRRDETVRVAA